MQENILLTEWMIINFCYNRWSKVISDSKLFVSLLKINNNKLKSSNYHIFQIHYHGCIIIFSINILITE